MSGLWYDQFAVDCGAFSRAAGPPGALLALFLDRPPALRAALALGLAGAGLALRRPLGFLAVRGLASRALWSQYLSWSRIVYSPLPAKLYFAGLLWREVRCPARRTAALHAPAAAIMFVC